ncbi:MAG: hypothetical protein ABI199_04735, partial [Bacteroidia bacterium]
MKKIFLLLFIGISFTSFSQINSEALQTSYNFSAKDTNKLILAFNDFNFLQNTEYFGPIVSGETLFGTELNSRLAYVVNPYLRIDLGMFARKDFGNPNFTTIAPVFNLKLQKNGYSLQYGNYEGCMDHQYIEPLFSYENRITNPLENGIQAKINKKRVWVDLWINWASQEYPGSTYQEHIISGLSSKFTIFEPSDVFKIQIPVQYLINHHGGQIDSDPVRKYETLLNGAVGMNFVLDLSKYHGFITKIESDNYSVGYRNGSRYMYLYLEDFIEGNGAYYNVQIESKYHISLWASYWHGHTFICPTGAPLFESISQVYGSYQETNRRLVFLNLNYMYQILPDLYAD